MKRQGNIISAIMENFDIAQNVLTSSLESAGSAMQEYNTYLEGIEAKTNQFKAAFEALSTTVVNSDFLKRIIELGTGAITILDKIIQSLGGMGSTLLIIGGIIASFNLSGTLSLLSKIGHIFKTGIFDSSFVKGIQAAHAGLVALKTKSEAAASAFTLLGGATSVASTALTSLVAIIGIAIVAYNNYQQKIEDMIQAAEDDARSFNDSAKSLDDYKSKIIELKNELDKGNLSEEEAYNARKNLLSIHDELVKFYGDEAKSIDLLKGSADDASASIDGLTKSLANRYLTENASIIDRAIREMETEKNWLEGTGAIGWSNSNAEVTKRIKEIVAKYSNASLSYPAITDDGNEWMVLEVTANAADAEETITELATDFRQMREDFLRQGIDIDEIFPSDLSFSKKFENWLENASSITAKYGEIYQEQILWKIASVSDYSNIMKEINDAESDYQQALVDNYDTELDRSVAVEEALQKMNAAKEKFASIDFGTDDQGVKNYLQNIIEEFEDFSKSYQAEFNIKAVLSDPDDLFGTLIKDSVEKFKQQNGKIDLYEVLNTGIEYDQNPNKNSRRNTLSEDQQAYVKLKFAADDYGISVEELLVLLDKLDYIELENADATQETARTYFDSIAQIRKSYDSLKSATENAVDAQVTMKGVFADNTHLSEDAYNALVALAGGETNLAGCIDTTNGYLVTNAELLHNIVDGSNEALLENIKLARSHEKLNYHELVKQLHDVTNNVEDYDDATLNTIDTILDQIDVTKQQIAQYKLLEQQLLGVTNAFTEMENAQKIDEAADYTDDLAGMIQTLFDSFSNNEFGTETFWTAFQALVPEDIYGQFEDAGDQIEAGWDYLNNVLSRYYSSDDGNISIDFDNIKNFVADGLNTAFGDSSVFIGTLESFELNPQINTLEEFAEAMNLTTTEAFALGNAISKYSADNEDFLSNLEVETLENQIYACDQAMAELLEKQTEIGKAGKVGTDEWNALQAEIDETKSKMEELRSTARENITTHIEIDAQITEKQKEVDSLKSDLDSLDETDAEYEATMTNYVDAQDQLATLLQQKYDLELPTELTIQVALEQVQQEITDTQAELDKIAEFDGKTYTAVAGVDQTEVDALVDKLDSLESEQSQIMLYAGIDDEDVLSSLETIQNFVIDDKGFNVTFDNYKTTRDRLVDVRDILKEIKDKTVYVTTITKTQGSKATGITEFSGNAHENGSWGTPTAEKNALVGELGEELVVDPRTGTYQTVGTNGAEFVDLPKGAIVFNHKQTEGLLKNRRINSRGIAYAQGNAHFTFLDRTYSLGNDSVANSNVDVTVTVKSDIGLEEQLEDTLKEMDDEISKIVAAYEHKIFLNEKNNGDPSEIIAIYKEMQNAVHEQAEEYRKLGLSEDSEYIMNLQKQWWDYHDEIVDTITSMYDEIIAGHENSITLTENWLEQAIQSANYFDISRYTRDIVEHYREMQNTIHEQAEYYRSLGYSDTSDEVSKLSDLWWDYYDKIKTVSAEAWEQVVDNANDALDHIQGMYDGLKNAAQEYAEYGYITVDSLQDILSYGVEYLAFLQDENGQLVINEGNIQRIIAARTQQMAIESALNYVEQLGIALKANDTVALLNLTDATNIATASTWDLVYAQLQLLGLSDEQYRNALQRINVMRSLTEVAVTSIGSVGVSSKGALEETKKAAEETASALDDLLKYVEEMIKQEVENQIDALDEQVDKYREIVNLQKKSLDLEREKDKYTKDVSKKTKSIAELQARIAQLDLDDSREAQAEKRKLQEQLANEQEDLAETQADHAYDATSDMLDKMADSYEDEKNKEIKILKDSISSQEKIYQFAINRIDNNWNSLYDDLLEWNYQYGSTVQSELISAWNSASGAVQQYGSYLNAVAATQAKISSFEINDISNNAGNIIAPIGDYDTSGGLYNPSIIINKMKENSAKWFDLKAANDQAGLDALEQDQQNLANLLRQVLPDMNIERKDGTWYINGEELYKSKYATYHTGGVVGDNSTPKQDEMFALLKKREAVLTEPQQEITYRILKADETIAGKLGISGGLYRSMNGSGYAEMQSNNAVIRDMKQAQVASGGNHVSQSIGDITVPVHVMVTEKLDKSDLQRLSREIGNIAGEEIAGSFIRAGKGTLKGSRLRP